MIRLYVPFDLSAGAAVSLEGDHSRYLVSVMRRGVGDDVALFNGRDGEWRARIAAVAKRALQLILEDQLRPQATGPDLDLIIALVKRTRLETVIEKAAELGARRVRPVVTARTNAETARVARLAAIAMEAAEQTGRLDVPVIAEPVRLDALLRDWDDGRRLLFCDEGGEAPPVLAALAGRPPGPWAILIGPEGGFSPEERARLRELPYAVPASLGPRILRADTAAISAMTLWQAALGDSKA
jgi:16S rRNA (uracil1498-N3)-methyltransferase